MGSGGRGVVVQCGLVTGLVVGRQLLVEGPSVAEGACSTTIQGACVRGQSPRSRNELLQLHLSDEQQGGRPGLTPELLFERRSDGKARINHGGPNSLHASHVVEIKSDRLAHGWHQRLALVWENKRKERARHRDRDKSREWVRRQTGRGRDLACRMYIPPEYSGKSSQR